MTDFLPLGRPFRVPSSGHRGFAAALFLLALLPVPAGAQEGKEKEGGKAADAKEERKKSEEEVLFEAIAKEWKAGDSAALAARLPGKRKVSLRVRNFETARLKVSDADGNPVEIAAVVVYKVTDPAKAAFAVDDHVQYVAVQAEAAVRHLATSYPYEAHESGRASLRDSAVVSGELTTELAERVELVGGALEHGPNPRGDFVLRARLPWAP